MNYVHINPDDYPKSTPKWILNEIDQLQGRVKHLKEKLYSQQQKDPANGQFGWNWYDRVDVPRQLVPVGERPFVALDGSRIEFFTRRISRKHDRLRLVVHGERALIVRPGASNEILIEQESY
jgi:hypothetical protein